MLHIQRSPPKRMTTGSGWVGTTVGLQLGLEEGGCEDTSETQKESLSRARLCDTMDSTVHGILQARMLEWVAFPFSRGSSQPRD